MTTSYRWVSYFYETYNSKEFHITPSKCSSYYVFALKTSVLYGSNNFVFINKNCLQQLDRSAMSKKGNFITTQISKDSSQTALESLTEEYDYLRIISKATMRTHTKAMDIIIKL
jgi:hypothetical protein